MAARPPSRSSTGLEPPRASVELHDPGARDLVSSEDEEYFSDASEGRKRSRPESPLRAPSPIPRTRVEKVDDEPRYGEAPGSPAYKKRLQDAVPDEVEVVPEGRLSNRNSRTFLEPTYSPGDSIIPRTVVEKVDPSSPSHGDVPGTLAYEKRLADAAPDVVIKAPEPGKKGPAIFTDEVSGETPNPMFPIPETIVTRVDSHPTDIETDESAAHEIPQADAEPDDLETHDDTAGSPTLDSFARLSRPKDLSQDDDDTHEDENFGDDFDDFEQGAQGGEDDFGDFDDSVEEYNQTGDTAESTPEPIPSFPLIDYTTISSFSDLLAATQPHLDAIFPSTADEEVLSLPEPESIPLDSPIFPTDRSKSLWKQLVTPPPLQPPNWIKSHTRRLFLVSLGVPVDLDEILPPSNQKKLVLLDINLRSPSRLSESDKAIGSIARLKSEAANKSNTSLESGQSTSKSSRRKPKGPPPAPELDLGAVKRLCATTVEKVNGFTDAELQEHVKTLESVIGKASEVLEYWLKRRDGALKEKEAFEGVIENLVRHARRVRK